jgi:hypothetical protein
MKPLDARIVGTAGAAVMLTACVGPIVGRRRSSCRRRPRPVRSPPILLAGNMPTHRSRRSATRRMHMAPVARCSAPVSVLPSAGQSAAAAVLASVPPRVRPQIYVLVFPRSWVSAASVSDQVPMPRPMLVVDGLLDELIKLFPNLVAARRFRPRYVPKIMVKCAKAGKRAQDIGSFFLLAQDMGYRVQQI